MLFLTRPYYNSLFHSWKQPPSPTPKGLYLAMHSRTGTEMIARHSRWKLLAVERTRPGIVFTGRVLYASVRGNEVIWKHELINVTPATEILACINMRSVLWWRPHCFSFTSRGGPNKNWEQHCMALINLCQLSYKV